MWHVSMFGICVDDCYSFTHIILLTVYCLYCVSRITDKIRCACVTTRFICFSMMGNTKCIGFVAYFREFISITLYFNISWSWPSENDYLQPDRDTFVAINHITYMSDNDVLKCVWSRSILGSILEWQFLFHISECYKWLFILKYFVWYHKATI